MGQARLALGKIYLSLDIVYFIPTIRISTSELCRQLFLISFNNNKIIISRNSLNICFTKMENELYMLRPDE